MFERIIQLPAGPLFVGLAAFVLYALGYVVLAGTTHLLLRVVFRKHFEKYQLSRRPPSRADVHREIRNAVPALLARQGVSILTAMGYKAGLLQMDFAVRSHGIVYLLLSVPLLMILHDASDSRCPPEGPSFWRQKRGEMLGQQICCEEVGMLAKAISGGGSWTVRVYGR